MQHDSMLVRMDEGPPSSAQLSALRRQFERLVPPPDPVRAATREDRVARCGSMKRVRWVGDVSSKRTVCDRWECETCSSREVDRWVAQYKAMTPELFSDVDAVFWTCTPHTKPHRLDIYDRSIRGHRYLNVQTFGTMDHWFTVDDPSLPGSDWPVRRMSGLAARQFLLTTLLAPCTVSRKPTANRGGPWCLPNDVAPVKAPGVDLGACGADIETDTLDIMWGFLGEHYGAAPVDTFDPVLVQDVFADARTVARWHADTVKAETDPRKR